MNNDKENITEEIKQTDNESLSAVDLRVSVPTNYLELNWLAKKNKDISLPFVMFDNLPYGGFYCAPERGEILINEKYYPLDKGLIGIDIGEEDNFVINTIAHEWRHHWQVMNGWELDSIGWNFDNDKPYEQKIIKYFRSSRSEMDALRYSNKILPCDTTLQWYDWLLQNEAH